MPWSSMASELSTEAQALGPPPSSHRSEIHSRTFASGIITSLNFASDIITSLNLPQLGLQISVEIAELGKIETLGK